VAALLLTGIGLAMVYSTTLPPPGKDTAIPVARGVGGADLFAKQALYAGAGLVAAFLLLAIDYRLLLQYSPGLYAISLLMLLYLPLFGPRIAGARSWIRIGGGFQIQPSEFAKIALALLLAWILENDDAALLSRRTLVAVTAAVAAPVALVLLQPDLGVALTYVPLLLTALFFGGLRARWWATLALAGVLLAAGSWFFLKEYQKDRIRTFLDPDLKAQTAGYQVRQARIAIGSGGIVGKGWREGTQSRLGFLPVRHTDFVFAALAEEGGFVRGVAPVIGLFALLLLRAAAIAKDSRDRGGAMLVLLLAFDLVAQAAVNIAMNVGLVPTTGITLPFLSYGGSSMLASWAMVGLMLSVAYRRFVNV
jgi:rod shape determining protein RodA